MLSVHAYSDGTESQTVPPAKLQAAESAGVLQRFSATRETPELYTGAAPTRSPSSGRFSFPDVPAFTPNRSPEEVLRAGAFGGSYFRPIASGVRKRVLADAALELPEAWRGKGVALAGLKYDAAKNKYGVKCGADLAEWESSGWITNLDPYGWFQWYSRFFQGRRSWDDARQISRWAKVCGDKGRWRTNLIAKVVAAGAAFDDAKVSPVVRQTLLHWGYELTEADFEKYAKKVKAGAKTAFIKGGTVAAATTAAPGGGGGGTAAAEPLAGKKRLRS